ncbi:hypothetical protein H5410_026892 [Solanum commersonii]|uniref:Uncharacterized protein n=1 Tax=Solanum commersonii TaxID=4109 RepID=A0A9J5Z072_SOLCO|nr:hypothetical protein H5410_026892 [Solanum commersonii]
MSWSLPSLRGTNTASRHHEPWSSPLAMVLIVVLGPVARPHCLGLHDLKESPRAVVFTISREVVREGEPNLRQPW